MVFGLLQHEDEKIEIAGANQRNSNNPWNLAPQPTEDQEHCVVSRSFLVLNILSK